MVQHGTLVIEAEGVTGYQIWELFGAGWSRQRSARHHRCAQVQRLSGVGVGDASACIDCSGVYALEETALESDCPKATRQLEGPSHLAVGPVPAALEGEEPFPGSTFGWYASWDGEAFEPMGFLFNEALETGRAPVDTGVGPGARVVFWPAWSWQLDGDE